MDSNKTVTYGFGYKKGKSNLDFTLSKENASDFLEILKKATEDVEQLIADTK